MEGTSGHGDAMSKCKGEDRLRSQLASDLVTKYHVEDVFNCDETEALIMYRKTGR